MRHCLVGIIFLILFVFTPNLRAEFYGEIQVGLHPIATDRYGASVFIPANFTPDRDWPLAVILFSDESEKGDLFNQKWISELQKRQEIGLFVSFLRPRESPLSSDERLKRLINEIKNKYPIDGNRVLLSAYGEAGHYAFYLGYRYPELFSAIGIAAGGAEGAYEVFYNHDQFDAKARKFLVLYGDQDATIQKDGFIAVHQELKNRGFQIEIEEFQGLDHQFHPQFAVRILDWFEALPVMVTQSSEVDGVSRFSPNASNLSFGLPRYIVAVVRGLIEN